MSVTPSHTFLNLLDPSATLKPLTTRWTLPDSCTSGNNYFEAICCSWSTCHPSLDWSTYQYAQSLYYSPGVCPTNFNYAATSLQYGSITLAVCCPPGFEHWDGDAYCSHALVSSDFSGRFSSLMTEPSAPDGGALGHTIWTQAVSVAWQRSDLSRFTPSAAPALDLSRLGLKAQVSAAPSAAPSNGKQSSNLSPSSNRSSGLSTGAAAGIGIGATLGVVALVIALWYMSKRYKRRVSGQDALRHTKQRPSEKRYAAPHQLPGQNLYEAPWMHQQPTEIDGTNRVELPDR